MSNLPPESDSDPGNSAESSPGWDAIDAQLDPIYGLQEPKHWGVLIPYQLGGSDPLTGISAYQAKDGSHWHYITYGFTELYSKETEEAEYSGYGFELTFRLAVGPVEAEPPDWPVNFLQNIARYVFETGNVFEAGHTMSLNGPIQGDSETKIQAVTFVDDPQLLADVETANGSFRFLQILGLTSDELQAMEGWNSAGFCELMKAHNPLLVTDLQRESYLTDPSFAAEVEAATRRDGASSASLSTSVVDFKPASSPMLPPTITLGALATESLARRLLGRIPFGRDFDLISKDKTISFVAADQVGWAIHDDTLTIRLTAVAAQAIAAALKPVAGKFSVSAANGLLFEVQRTNILGRDGEVVSVVG